MGARFASGKKIKTRIGALILSGAGLLAWGCGEARLNAGSDKGGPMSGEGDAGTQPESRLWPHGMPSNSFDLPCTLPPPNGLGGTWVGQFDSHQLPSGSRAIKLEIKGYQQPRGFVQAVAGLCGTVTFGSGPPFPVATDPTAPPPGIPYDPTDSTVVTTAARTIVEGFTYEFNGSGTAPSITDAGAPDPQTPELNRSRLQFNITLRQIFKSWCNLQYSYGDQDITPSEVSPLLHSGAHCVPPDTFSTGTEGLVCPGIQGFTVLHVPCDQATLCLFVPCYCNTWQEPDPIHGCTINDPGFGETRFDLTANGDTLSGTVVLLEGVEAVHLARVP